jgi:hypothetical protein
LPAAFTRTITFSGLTWYVRSSGNALSSPGPNVFSDSQNNVWVDSSGRLHLRITKKGRKTACAEVIAATSVGYGAYRFYLETPVTSMDPNAVLGLFTWNDAADFNHREIDIEFGRWGSPKNPNAQYVVQPHTGPANIFRFEQPSGAKSTHLFVWQPNAVDFLSLHGHRSAPSADADVIQRWSGFSSIPIPGGENPRINLWLSEGRAPAADVDVVLTAAEFVALPPPNESLP